MNDIRGINRIIFDDIGDRLESYGVDLSAKEKIKEFLRTSPKDYSKRQQYAKQSITSILHYHGKAQLSEEIAILGEIEGQLIPIQDKLRDHVTHTLLTFLLGVYLIEKLQLNNKITHFEWKLTSLLHDIAYSYEIAYYLTKKIEEHINGLAIHHRINVPMLKTSYIINNLDKLARSPSSIGLLTSKFKKWGFRFCAGTLYKEMKSHHDVDHGMISSMLVLKTMDILYNHHNPDRIREYKYEDDHDWNYDNFDNQIVNSCASIFLHNLPIERFQFEKIDKMMHTLPFILRLSDELQDWERITKDGSYNSAKKYSISIIDDTIRFSVPPSRRDKIESSINCFQGQRIIVDTIAH